MGFQHAYICFFGHVQFVLFAREHHVGVKRPSHFARVLDHDLLGYALFRIQDMPIVILFLQDCETELSVHLTEKQVFLQNRLIRLLADHLAILLGNHQNFRL